MNKFKDAIDLILDRIAILVVRQMHLEGLVELLPGVIGREEIELSLIKDEISSLRKIYNTLKSDD